MFSLANLLTALNLICGSLAVIFILQESYEIAFWLLILAAVVDFLDGWVARKLQQESELGTQLDSLADVISFGLAPGCIAFQLFQVQNMSEQVPGILAYVGLLLPVMSAFRLARFNLKTSHVPVNFEGLPTPAMGLFFAGLLSIVIHPSELISKVFHPMVILFLVVLFSWLMISKISILKIKQTRAWMQEHFLLILIMVGSLVSYFWVKEMALSISIALYILYCLTRKFST
ncbi:MAG: CDP-diacylglycerol--serine O-phosphatidyltransferase [Bacteroidota bacterium]|nr:CDP-diacylglycerol--serine O-phosphatidyltransferase [Bacteroidota bacterium]